MRSVVNTEIAKVAEYERFKQNPYPNSDFAIGRSSNPRIAIQNFADNLLLYDRIYLATVSFQEVMTLKSWLGGNVLEKLMRDGVIKFVQTPFSWTYIQKWKKENGAFGFNGIAALSLVDKKGADYKPFSGVGKFPKETLGGWSSPDLEKAVTYTLTKFYNFNHKKVGKFARVIANNSIQLNSDDFRGFITKKTEEELSNSEIRKELNFSELIDIENIPDKSPDIRRLFRLISANQQVAIMNSLPQADLFAEQFYIEALRYPLTNELRNSKLINQSQDLFSMEKIPFPNILGTELTLLDIVKIRNSNEAVNFRKWLHDHIDSMEDVKGAYVDLLKRDMPFMYRLVSLVAQPILSAGTQSITNLPGMIVDSVIGSVAEFKIKSFAERYLNPNPPKFFMETIKKEIKSKI